MNKVLITGASSGIGLALAQLLLSKGAEVTGVARKFAKAPAEMQQVALDLGELDGLSAALNENDLLNQDFDTLVLNAGYGKFGGLESFSEQQISHLINTNLVSQLFLLKHYLPKFKQQEHKDIVIVGSESALAGAKQGAVYCASKFALRGMAQSLRADCANSDIRVMLINPGPVDSSFFDELGFVPQAGEGYTIEPQQVAEAIVNALSQARNLVSEEINIQPIKRAFTKKR